MDLDYEKSLARIAWRNGADIDQVVESVANHIAVRQTLYLAGYLAVDDEIAANTLRSAVVTDHPAESRAIAKRHRYDCDCGCKELLRILRERDALAPPPSRREALQNALDGLQRMSRLIAEATAEIRQRSVADPNSAAAADPIDDDSNDWDAWERGPFRPVDLTDPDGPIRDDVDDDSGLEIRVYPRF